MKIYRVIFLWFIIISLLTGCTTSHSGADHSENLTIYTSVYPIQYAAEQIGGDSVNVKSVYPPGVDPHTYKPSSRDLTSIADSDAFIYLGERMEALAETTADALASQDVALIELGVNDYLFLKHAHKEHSHKQSAGDDKHHDYNPHIWLDPKRMIDMSNIIKKEMIELDPDNKHTYKKNFKMLKKDLLALDDAYQNTLNTKKQKTILVSHAAYGYWEERYGINQIAINGLSSNDEPSQKDLTRIIDEARNYDLDYLLFEQNTPDQVAKIIQNHVNVKRLFLHNLSILTKEDIKNGEDYESLMYHNLDTLDKATN